MRVFVTGATGFLGRALALRLQRDGHQVLAWVRDLERGRNLLGADVELVPATDDATLARAIGRSEAVVNLAGASILGGRWTAARRRVLAESRVGVTHRIVRTLADLRRRPAVLVSASAVGFYGDRRDEVLTEGASAGGDFLAQLCRDWEIAAERAGDSGSRVVRIRIGVVLGRGGGALAKMLPAFRLGVGGPFGSGRQYVPWIHLEDVVSMFAAALADPRWTGPVNGTAPAPVTSRELARALGAALHRPALLPIPGFLLKAAFGQAATVLLASQRAVPARPDELGFSFAFPTIAAALADLVGDAGVTITSVSRGAEPVEVDSTYLARRRPRYLLRAHTRLAAPAAAVFDFFSRPENLGSLTPPAMKLRIRAAPAWMAQDVAIEYRLRVGGVPLGWRTRIAGWQPPRLFVDAQEAGPYRSWWHEHHFEGDAFGTAMEDRVYYTPPYGWLAPLLHRLFIARALRGIFGFRAQAIRLRFDAPPANPAAGDGRG